MSLTQFSVDDGPHNMRVSNDSAPPQPNGLGASGRPRDLTQLMAKKNKITWHFIAPGKPMQERLLREF
jgi:hypothetical protein